MGFDLDTLCNWSDYNLKSENKTVCYSYEFIKLAYFYLKCIYIRSRANKSNTRY